MDTMSCSPCSREGTKLAAVKYCVDCDSHLCAECLKQHNRFDVLKSHQIVDKAAELDTPKDKAELPTQRCPTHHGKLIDMYCEDHDEVCCVACVAIYHSHCKGITYLPQAAAGYTHNTTDEIAAIKDRVSQLQTRLDAFIPGKQDDTTRVNDEKESILQKIKVMKDMVVKHFDELEAQISSALDVTVNGSLEEITGDINKLEETVSALKNEVRLLEEQQRGTNRSSLFVQIKLTTSCEKRGLSLEKMLSSKRPKTIEFNPNLKLYTFLDELKTMGEIFHNYFAGSSATTGECSIHGSKEKNVCDISSACALHDGSILLTDFKNETIKKELGGFIVQSRELPGPPLGICYMDHSTVLVSLWNKMNVKAISTSNLKATHDLHVGKPCRGIAYNDSLMYVTCGGWTEGNEGPGYVAVYQIIQHYQRKESETSFESNFLKTINNQIGFPHQIATSKDGSVIYIADADTGLIIMTKYGRVLDVFNHKDMDTPVGVCLGPKNRLFVCGGKSNNVMLLTADGHYLKTVLTEDDGVLKPMSLCYSEEKSRLVITMSKNDKMKTIVFNNN
ncbi:E3 ubiquitin-protein ligase TRIM71-like [Mercenaria mercenaria]|uniref:E3 ubiquitin-protein ligase TRIM71-like n=1 Tax=Mercenaria mercenaria TaxID=6596 RepID=UPI00234E736F|nr:E3 ubiquitin-protein ligase TRIM71-like [Mercenaria mercenaria]